MGRGALRHHVLEHSRVHRVAKLVTLGEITTGMAHELSQPLNVIKMARQGLRQELSNTLRRAAAQNERVSSPNVRVKTNGDFMAIVLDGRVQGRPPVIQGQITRSGQITLGNRSLQEAQDLALTLRAGSLPVHSRSSRSGRSRLRSARTRSGAASWRASWAPRW